MFDAIREIKTRAEILHRRIREGDRRALERLRAVPGFRGRPGDSGPAALAAGAEVQRKHCLAVISRELGFAGWQHALRVLRGDPGETDMGKLLYHEACGGHLNHWFASYEDARAQRVRQSGYLLGYQRQFFVVDRYYIETLGLDPDDRDWEALGWDWIRPRQADARARLYGKLLAARPAEAA